MLIDAAITNVSFGYFAPGWKFNYDSFLGIITFSLPYHFTTTPYEFQIFSFIRQSFCAIAVLLIILNKREKVKVLFPVVICNAVVVYSLSLIKFLAFSEDSNQLYFPGLWFSVIWSILSGFIQVLVWYFVFTSNPFDYHRLLNTTAENAGTSVTETAAETVRDTETASNVESGELFFAQKLNKIINLQDPQLRPELHYTKYSSVFSRTVDINGRGLRVVLSFLRFML